MKLDSKKRLAAKTLNVGINRILFDINRLDEIKEAITKQDIRDLNSTGAIKIKTIVGRGKKEKRKTRKRAGKIRRRVNKRKENYVIMTKKLRSYIKELKDQDKINEEKYKELRKKIKMKNFKNKKHLRENI
ncbi:MAG TPA: 50S ribosomal protein L19e [Candidatus Paceibacterota bacterium]|nr:50S ribosomal protein L19e [Candidatus Paceibacterota bacterium]